MSDSDTPILLFDNDCGFCQHCVRFFNYFNTRGRVSTIALQHDNTRESMGLSYEKAAQTIHFQTASGTIFTGAQAINAAADAVLGAPVCTMIYRIPGMPWFQEKMYDYISRNRYRLPGSHGQCALSSIPDKTSTH